MFEKDSAVPVSEQTKYVADLGEGNLRRHILKMISSTYFYFATLEISKSSLIQLNL